MSANASTSAYADRHGIDHKGKPARFDTEQRLAEHFRDVVENAGDDEKLHAEDDGEIRR